jgi:Ser/Thr protein kinase RdoA (MazF antagonist)
MYDAATPVSFYEHEPQVPVLIDAWKTGYRKVIDLSRAEAIEIPTFCDATPPAAGGMVWFTSRN